MDLSPLPVMIKSLYHLSDILRQRGNHVIYTVWKGNDDNPRTALIQDFLHEFPDDELACDILIKNHKYELSQETFEVSFTMDEVQSVKNVNDIIDEKFSELLKVD